MTDRKIIHIDMDAFYASVEQRDNPELLGKAIAVGGSRERGVVAAASYEARKFGIRSAMPSVTAARLCPHLIFVKPRFEQYKKVSVLIHDIFHRYTDIIEPLSLDEAYLDVTENKIGMPSATLIAQDIRSAIHKELNLTASAGISYNKFIAKTASDYNKPNGMHTVTPDMADTFISELAIERFFGVGKVTAEKMKSFGIFFGKDLKKFTREQLSQWFGKQGGYFYDIARGIDTRKVNPHRIRKSVGVERTYEKDLIAEEDIHAAIGQLSHMALERLERSSKEAKTLTVKIKFNDFTQITRGKTSLNNFKSIEEVEEIANGLLQFEEIQKPIRLLGLTFSNFDESKEGKQLTLEF